MKHILAAAVIVALAVCGAAYGQGIDVNPAPADGNQRQIISQFLSTDGTATGPYNANGSYDTTSTGIFYIEPPAGEVWRIRRMMVSIRDDGQGFTAVKYGAIATLTNGITVEVWRNGAKDLMLTAQDTVKSNADWGTMCYDVSFQTFGSSTDAYLAARWTFLNSGQYIRLDGDTNDQLRVICRDNLSALEHHHFLVQGYKEYTRQ